MSLGITAGPEADITYHDLLLRRPLHQVEGKDQSNVRGVSACAEEPVHCLPDRYASVLTATLRTRLS